MSLDVARQIVYDNRATIMTVSSKDRATIRIVSSINRATIKIGHSIKRVTIRIVSSKGRDSFINPLQVFAWQRECAMVCY